jgi:hypothetical protein
MEFPGGEISSLLGFFTPNEHNIRRDPFLMVVVRIAER